MFRIQHALIAVALLLSSGAAAATERVEAARLLEVMKVDASMKQAIATLLDAQVKANPALAPYRGTMAEFFEKYMSYEAIKPKMIEIYNNTFTEQELAELRTFYSTPTGRKAIEQLPNLMAQGSEIGRQLVQEHMPELAEMVKAQDARLKAAPAKNP